MIAKIRKIKHLGLVFGNYTWDTSLPPFKRFNIFYGWNGCGKTTLSRLFSALDGNVPKTLEYEVEDDKGQKYKQGEAFPNRIRVFNQDYIHNNVNILEGRTNSISILLGAENKELAEQIAEDRKLLNGDPADPSKLGKMASLAAEEKELARKSSSRDGHFTDIAKTIGAAIGGNALRDYRKPQAEKEFAALKSKAELQNADLAKYTDSAKQESLQTIEAITFPTIEVGGRNKALPILDVLHSIAKEANEILGKSVKAETIPRLASNNDIADWVEQGVKLHEKHASRSCEFCLQAIPQERSAQLGLHFNVEDTQMKQDLDTLLDKLRNCYKAIDSIRLPDRARFYKDQQSAYDTVSVTFVGAQKALLESVQSLAGEIKDKKNATTETRTLSTKLNTDLFRNAFEAVRSAIAGHNKITSDFEGLKKQAAVALKTHYLSTIYDAVKALDIDLGNLKTSIASLKGEIGTIQECISTRMAQISSKHKACDVLNQHLATFLGHQELTFVPRGKQAVEGYSIMRGTQPATYLSEGEKTAIAFVYFVVHLGDEHFTVADGIVVVDDPISSLDSNSIYQAFSFLKNAVKDGGQVFILTHNFDFLKLLINWRKHGGGAGFYMIKNAFTGSVRSASIEKMDKELQDYESEYHYLFKLLKVLRDDQDGSIAKAYPVPNIARKVWDTFLMFNIPDGKNPYQKMEMLKREGFDEQKLDAIYKFTNDQSHITGAGFSPALIPEVKKVLAELFEMMAQIAPRHFKVIDEATK